MYNITLKNILIGIVIVSISINIYFVFFKTQKTIINEKIVYKTKYIQGEPKIKVVEKVIPKETIVTKTIVKYIKQPKNLNDTNQTIKPKQHKNIFVENINNYDIKTKDETITLTTRYDRFKKYKISLKSNKKITSILPSGSYILINGTIEENSIKSKFDFSFNEYYSQFSQDLYLEVTNNENNTTTKCDGSFLNGATSEYRYNIKLDIMGDLLSCYIVSQNKMPSFKEIFNNKLKRLEINSSILKMQKD
jgi:hypothetical protein